MSPREQGEEISGRPVEGPGDETQEVLVGRKIPAYEKLRETLAHQIEAARVKAYKNTKQRGDEAQEIRLDSAAFADMQRLIREAKALEEFIKNHPGQEDSTLDRNKDHELRLILPNSPEARQIKKELNEMLLRQKARARRQK